MFEVVEIIDLVDVNINGVGDVGVWVGFCEEGRRALIVSPDAAIFDVLMVAEPRNVDEEEGGGRFSLHYL